MTSVHAVPGSLERGAPSSPCMGPSQGQAERDGSDFAIGEEVGLADSQGLQKTARIDEVDDPAAHDDEESIAADMLPMGEDLAGVFDEQKITSENPLVQIMESWSGISRALSTADTPATETEMESWPSIGTKANAPTSEPAIIEADKKPLLQTAALPDMFIGSNEEPHQIRDALETAAPAPSGRPSPHAGAAVLQQLAEAMVKSRGDRLEIALSSEELGRLRLVLSRENGIFHIQVWAERPEILELIRRNSDLLLEHFAEKGADQPSLSFSNDAAEDGSVGHSEKNDAATPEFPEATVLVAVEATGFNRLSTEYRVDIRL